MTNRLIVSFSLIFYLHATNALKYLGDESIALLLSVWLIQDRLFSAFGQDTIDALYWTATEPKGKKREHIGVVAHLLLGKHIIIVTVSEGQDHDFIDPDPFFF